MADCFKDSYDCYFGCVFSYNPTITLIKLKNDDGWQVRVND